MDRIRLAAVVGTAAGSLIGTGAVEPVLAIYDAAVFLWWPAVGGIVVVLIASAVRRTVLPSWVHVAVPVVASAAWAGVGTHDIRWTVALTAPVLVAASAAALGATRTKPRVCVAITLGGVAAAVALMA